MSAYDPTRQNGRVNKEFYRGAVIKAADGGTLEQRFKYSVVKSRKYSVTNSAMPFEFISPSETIRTTRLDINFVSGDIVRLHNGQCMKVKDLEKDINPYKAKYGTGETAWILYLEGGAPS